jgi:dTDP-4-dehydrorhamnose 3,5-epimerase-like enzyme
VGSALPSVEITVLSDNGDLRGSSFPLDSGWLDFLGYAVDCHVMTIRPAQTRGNHYHSRKREILIVMHKDRWTMCWDGGSGTAAQKREFAGAGAVVVKVFPSAAHAIVNSGGQDLHVMALCNEAYDAARADATGRVVTG